MMFAGLGNPGARYESTRHNLGFQVIDLIAERWGRPHFAVKFRSLVAQAGPASGEGRHVLVKPQTFMNISGEAIAPAAAFFRIQPRDLLVIHDELDLGLGRVQLKVGGGAGGHNGLKSVAQHLGTQDFVRLRLGIGRPSVDFRGDVADFVLETPPAAEAAIMQKMVEAAAAAVEDVLEQGLTQAMNRINRRS
jgi:peptidyl-tRNA hydrolase, PTH1 family